MTFLLRLPFDKAVCIVLRGGIHFSFWAAFAMMFLLRAAIPRCGDAHVIFRCSSLSIELTSAGFLRIYVIFELNLALRILVVPK